MDPNLARFAILLLFLTPALAGCSEEEDTVLDSYHIKALNDYHETRYVELFTFINRTDAPQHGDGNQFSTLVVPKKPSGALIGCPDVYNPFYIRAVLREGVPEYYHPDDGIIQVTNWTGFQCGKNYTFVVNPAGGLDFYRGVQDGPPYVNRMDEAPV